MIRKAFSTLSWAFLLLPGVLQGQPAKPPATLADTLNYLEISSHLTTSGQIIYDHIKDIKKAGTDVVINLAPADEKRNGEEGFRVVEEGMSYVQIPVNWQHPSQRDLKLFFDVMDANQDRKVYVHCFANMRVSVFVYLYRTLREHVPEDVAWKDVLKVWDPHKQPQWMAFIDEARKEAKR